MLLYLMLGIVAGALASMFLKNQSFSALLMDIILGVFGAIAGGILMTIFSQPTGLSESDIYGIVLAVVGAVSWIAIGNKLKLV